MGQWLRWIVVGASLVACAFAIVSIANGSVAGMTHITGDWTIDSDTTLYNGTWSVDGSVLVKHATLRLDHAELVMGSGASMVRLVVDPDASISGTDSTVRGGEGGLNIRLNSGGTFEGCTFRNLTTDDYSIGIYCAAGKLVLERCTVEGSRALLWSDTELDIRGSRFEGFSRYGLEWTFSPEGNPGLDVRIEGTTFDGGGAGSLGLYLGGPGWEPAGWNVVVRGCTFSNCTRPLAVQGFTEVGRLLIEGNSARDCTNGASIESAGTAVTMRNDTWAVTQSGVGLSVELAGTGGPSVEGETIIGGKWGLSVTGESQTVEVRGLWVSGADVGVVCDDARLSVRDSNVSSTTTDFSTFRDGRIDIVNCTNSHRGAVRPQSNGRIRELFPMAIASVTWQGGAPIQYGTIEFLNETDLSLGEFELPAPGTAEITSWMVTHNMTYYSQSARACYSTGGYRFYGQLFTIDYGTSRDIVIVDDVAPSLFVDTPRENSIFRGDIIDLRGAIYEPGSGIGSVAVRADGGAWVAATIPGGWAWNATLVFLLDGSHTLEVNGTDRAGNSRVVTIGNVTTDSTPPAIEVLRPGHWTNVPTVQLIGTTERGSTLTVDGTAVTVAASGAFSVWVELADGPNSIEMEAVDGVGNIHALTYVITLDTRAPLITVERPLDGSWSWSTAIVVSGSTDEEAAVTVNGVPASIGPRAFYVAVNGTEGAVSIDVEAVDLAMNSASVTVSVIIDQAPPALEVEIPSDDSTAASSPIMVAGWARDVGPVDIVVGAGPVTRAGESWSAWVDLVEGWNSINVLAEDAAGNRASRTIRILLDTVPPVANVTIDVGPDVLPSASGAYTTGRSNVTLSVVTDEACILRINVGTEIHVAAGESRVTLELLPGTNELDISVLDSGRNMGETFHFTVDRDLRPPALDLTEPLDGLRTGRSLVSVRGITERGALVTVNGLPVEPLQNGSFELKLSLEEGRNTIRVTARDRFGNEATVKVEVWREDRDASPSPDGGPRTLLVVGALIGAIAAVAVVIARARTRTAPEEAARTDRADEGSGVPAQAIGDTRLMVRRGR